MTPAAARQAIRDADAIKRQARKALAADRPKRVIQARAVPVAKEQRQPRERNPAFLAWLRRQPCVAGVVKGGCSGPIQAAHVRYSDAKAGRVNSGLQSKPSDVWATSLCEGHHLHDQHTRSERAFWADLGIDPGELCPALFTAFTEGRPGEPVIRAYAGKAERTD